MLGDRLVGRSMAEVGARRRIAQIIVPIAQSVGVKASFAIASKQ